MQINKVEFLRCLEMVQCGISEKAIIEQSDCFVFRDGFVHTYNNQIVASMPIALEEEGAVKASKLVEVLNKIDDELVDVSQKETKAGGQELHFKGAQKKFGMYLETEINLPIDAVEFPDKNEDWKALNENFSEQMSLLAECCSTDQNKFTYTCIHFTPNYVEAMDGVQILRYDASAYEFPIEFLLRNEDVKEIIQCSVTEYLIKDKWVFFRNEDNLIVGCKISFEEYLNLDDHLNVTGQPVTIPRSIGEACEKANIFSAEQKDNQRVTVKLRPNLMQIEGEGKSGWYAERINVSWDGGDIRFFISPKVLTKVADNQSDTFLTESRLLLQGPGFKYVTVLGEIED